MRRAILAAMLTVAVARSGATQPAARERWPIKTREHVDLWLHSFAIVAPDSSPVPLYRRDYRDLLITARNAASAYTDLDVNADLLRATLRSRPALVGAQFLALEYPTWAEMDGVLDAFVRTDGNPRGAPQNVAQDMARLAALFRTKEERDFLRRFLAGVRSERDKFHHQWWLAETRRRDAALTRVDSLWVNRFRPALQSFLNHTQQANGEIFLSTVLEGEGRTVTNGKRENSIAVGFPETPDRAMDAIYCILHEIVGPLTGAAVEDNVTPAQKRSGEADRLQSLTLVRGGALLAAKLGADVVDGYMRFYLRAAGKEAGADARAAFEAAFPVPAGVLASVQQQISVAFSGI